MKKVLAIDYGTKRIGLAVSRASLAEPWKILQNQAGVIAQIQQLAEAEKCDLILLGLSENKMAEQTKKFGQRLQKATAVKLEYVDETLSSTTVRKKLATSPMKLKKKQGPIDHYAAAVFLQEWLDQK